SAEKTLGRLGGPQPSKDNPNPATCASGSEALRSKVSLRVSPAAPQAQGKRVLAKKAGCAGLFRQAGAAASRFRYHVPPVCFAQEHDVPFAAKRLRLPCSERDGIPAGLRAGAPQMRAATASPICRV